MDLFLAICQAIGLGLAFGIGGPLAALFAAVMANLQAGIDPRGTDWEFFGSEWFVTVLFAINVAAYLGQRRGLPTRIPFAIVAATVGAIAGAASLAEEGEVAAIGLVAGAIAGAAAALLAGDVLEGARKRAAGSGDSGATLNLIFAAAGVALAALALYAPPVSLVAAAALAAVALGRRRKAEEKYEGLRILR